MGLSDFFKKKEPETNSMNFDSSNSFDSNNSFSNPNSFSGSGNSFQNNDLRSDFMNNPSIGQSGSGVFGQQSFNQGSGQSQSDLQKDLQMISLKLDAIKSELDSMNQRLKTIETIAEKEQTSNQKNKKWY